MAASDSTGVAQLVQAGKLRVLNTWGEKRLPTFTEAPTLKELGIPVVQNSPFGFGAPRGTPPAVIKRLHDAFKKAMEEPSYVQTLAKYDRVPIYMSSAGYLTPILGWPPVQPASFLSIAISWSKRLP